jgi:hypothetical protein
VVTVEKNDMEKKIKEDQDFIHAPKYNNSLSKFLIKNDKLLENGAIGRLLLLSEAEVEKIYQESVKELRKVMNPD